MAILYNCRVDGDQYRITKFDEDQNVESSYLVSHTDCQCPAWEKRQRCRHLEMLPMFIKRSAIGTDWFLDYDRGGWVQLDCSRSEGLAQIPAEPEIVIVTTKPAETVAPKRASWRRM